MNIAFTTLVILILAVPGYIARSAYQTDKFTRDVLQRDITSDIVLAILYSIPFHFLGTAVINHLNLAGYTSARIDFDALFRLLAGQYGKDGQEFSRLSNNIYQHIHVIAIYFGCLVAVAFGTGIFLRNLVWKYRLDVKYPTAFAYRNRWVNILFGREQGDFKTKHLAVLEALTELEDQPLLYRGIVVGFTGNGDLSDIYLVQTYSGVFKTGSQVEWKRIPGDFFVLKYSEVKNLNLFYLDVSSPDWNVLFPQAQLSASQSQPAKSEQSPPAS